MNEITNWSAILLNSLQSFTNYIAGVLPSLVGAVLILIIGWFAARMIRWVVKRFMRLIKIDDLAARVNVDQMLQKANIKAQPSDIIAKFSYWIVMLLVLVTASETLGWTILSEELSKLIQWLPSLFAAIIFFLIGIFLATFIRDLINGATMSLGLQAGKVLSTIIYYLFLIMVTLSSLDQAGVDTSILHSNLLLIIASILLTGAISYGLASRDVLANVLATFFGKKVLKVGQKITYDDVTGIIIAINNINVVVQTPDKLKVVIPSAQLVNSRYIILEEPTQEI